MERLIIKILDEKGRVSIPKAIREQAGISLGDVLGIEADPPDCVILTRMEVVEPEEAEEPELTDDIFTQEFHKLSYSQQYRLLTALLPEFYGAYN